MAYEQRLRQEEQQQRRKMQENLNKEYANAYNNYLRSLGYKVKENWTKEKTKDLFPKKNHYTYHLNADDLSNVGNYYPHMTFDSRWFTGGAWHRFWNSIPKDLTAILTSAQKEHMYQYMLDRVDKFKEAIREQYLQDNQSVNEEIRKALEDNLRKSMEKYAEGLTEYMIMEEYNVK